MDDLTRQTKSPPRLCRLLISFSALLCLLAIGVIAAWQGGLLTAEAPHTASPTPSSTTQTSSTPTPKPSSTGRASTPTSAASTSAQPQTQPPQQEENTTPPVAEEPYVRPSNSNIVVPVKPGQEAPDWGEKNITTPEQAAEIIKEHFLRSDGRILEDLEISAAPTDPSDDLYEEGSFTVWAKSKSMKAQGGSGTIEVFTVYKDGHYRSNYNQLSE